MAGRGALTMKIRYRESGGFVGLGRGADIDTAGLPEDEAQKVETLVENAGLAAMAASTPHEARDLRGYEIAIEVETRKIVVRFDDSCVPSAADELLAYLQGRARPVPLE